MNKSQTNYLGKHFLEFLFVAIEGFLNSLENLARRKPSSSDTILGVKESSTMLARLVHITS